MFIMMVFHKLYFFLSDNTVGEIIPQQEIVLVRSHMHASHRFKSFPNEAQTVSRATRLLQANCFQYIHLTYTHSSVFGRWQQTTYLESI